MYTDQSDIKDVLNKVTSFESYVINNPDMFPLPKIEMKNAFNVDYKHLLENKNLLTEWESLATDIVNNTDFCLQCMGLAVHQRLTKINRGKSTPVPFVQVKIINFEPVLHLKNLRVNSYGIKIIVGLETIVII